MAKEDTFIRQRRRKAFLTIPLLCLLTAFLLTACQKDELPVSQEHAVQDTTPGQNPVPGILELRSDEEPRPTILGDPRVNPYTVEVMAQAWNNLYGDEYPLEVFPTTHLYLKFTPQDVGELAVLEESDLVLLDFPLEHEVVEMGDYYPQPWKTEEEIPDYFTVVEVGAHLPLENFEVLEELAIPAYFTYLVAEAFRITGNDFFDEIIGENPEGCDPECPSWPDCLLNPELSCGEEGGGAGGDPDDGGENGGDPDNGGGFGAPPCNPHADIWPECILDNQTVVPSTPYTTLECGCEVFSNPRKPGGCIRVEDTELMQMDGVRQVRVHWWDGWFTLKKTLTDDEGCWRIDHRESGKAYMWVKFKGPRASLRGFVGNTAQLWRLFVDIVDYAGQMGGGTYNNISITYNRWENQGSAAHRNWSAATVNNGIHEFWDQAAADGINTPFLHNDKPLDVFLAANRQDGFALMPHGMGPVRVGSVITGGLEIIDLVYPNVNINSGVLAGLSYTLFPDLMIGCDWSNSDQLRETIYHESAHASHFGQVGPDYWLALVLAEIAAWASTGDSWGNANSLDAGRIAICESWGDHLAFTYNHRRYGGAASAGITWERQLELTRNDSPNHVPIGLHHDLIDVDPLPEGNGFDNEGGGFGPVNDQVDGFTNALLFSVLTAQVVAPEAYRDALIAGPLLATGNTEIQLINLFNSY